MVAERAGSPSPGGHGWPGWALVAALAAFGAVLMALGLAEAAVPAAIRPATELDPADPTGRGLLILIGLCLLALAWGVLRFRRWAWWGAVAAGLLMAWPAIDGLLVQPLSGGAPELPVFQLIVALSLPYLWVRRRDFEIGTTRGAVSRGP